MSIRYGLYVVKPEDIGSKERHYLITPTYCLLYTSNEPPKLHSEIKDIALLPATAKAWLEECIAVVRTEYMAAKREEIKEKAKFFFDAFQKELEKEKLGLETEDTGGKENIE